VELARLREQPIRKIALELGISESCLHRWMDQADVDQGVKESLSSTERRELVELRRRNRVLEMEVEILKRASAFIARRTCSQNRVPAGPRARRRRVRRRGGLPGAEDLQVRLLRVARPTAVPARFEDAYLADAIRDIHTMSRCSYGAPRVHAERRLGDRTPA
jgi:transposase-like protein